MACPPAPPPPTFEEWRERTRNGAKTLKELDPELYKWLNSGKNVLKFGWIVILFSVIALLFILLHLFIYV